ncbi:hypothetical protein PR048_001372 [Dryococelus australis]|uniref:non-specific serine/threonine protein kinase n=1 Tax=Dryococelus australis TaxID=614101 RepID=A0ABQ9II59_9NEOP|nr:hypothetical protein PR048_001372 [Dryococelus australis]
MDASVKNSLEERLLRLSKLMLNTPLNAVNTSRLDFFKLLDALLILYNECKRGGRKEEPLDWFLNSYSTIVSEIRNLQVNALDFEEVAVIGSGRFGTVSVVKEFGTDRICALKVMRKDVVLRQLGVACFREERDIMVQASSPWLTSLQYAFQDTDNIYLAMDFHPGGSLSNLIEYFGGRLKEDMARFYLAELLLALMSLHNMGYVHRDVKPDNLLLDSGGHLKLADFGSASRLNSVGCVTNFVFIGTAAYIAPEVLNTLGEGCSFQENYYGVECDYWSYGIVTFELVTGFTPFIGDSEMQTHRNIVCHDQCFSFPKNVELSVEITDLVSKLVANAACRIKGDELFGHVFFNEIDWENQIHSHPPYIPTLDSPTDTSNFNTLKADKSVISVDCLKPKQYSDVPFVGFTFSRAVLGTTVGNLNDFFLNSKITEMQDRIHVLDTSSRAVEKWNIKCMLEKRELVRRLKHNQELCAISEQVSISFFKKSKAIWEKQHKIEKDQMTAKIEKLEQELKDQCEGSLGVKSNSNRVSQGGTVSSVCESVENNEPAEEKGAHLEAVLTELDRVKLELTNLNFEKDSNELELSHMKEMVAKLNSSLTLEKDKTEHMKQELELYRSRGVVFKNDEYGRLVNIIIKLQQEVDHVLSNQFGTEGPQGDVGKEAKNMFSSEDIVEIVGDIAAKAPLLRKFFVERSGNTFNVGTNTECAVSHHKAVQAERKPANDPLLLKVESEFQCLKQEQERDLAELRNTSAHYEAEIKRLADASREHAKVMEDLQAVNDSESRRIMTMCKEWVRTELHSLQEQLHIEKACASRYADELESFKKMFLDKNAEAHSLKKQLDCVERELRDELVRYGGERACDRGMLVGSVSQALQQLQEDKRKLQAANAALEKASADLEDQVDQYHNMVLQLQSQLLQSRSCVPLHNS